MAYAKVLLQKNGEVSPLLYTKRLSVPFPVPHIPLVPDSQVLDNAADSAKSDFIQPAIDGVSSEIAKHQIDIVVLIIGIVLIIASVGTLVRPFIP